MILRALFLAASLGACTAAPTVERATPVADAGASDFPMQRWMKANAAPAMDSKNASQLERSFDRIAAIGPSDWAEWSAVAADGKAAASRGDLDGCRAACRKCHESTRPRYRAELRTRSFATERP